MRTSNCTFPACSGLGLALALAVAGNAGALPVRGLDHVVVVVADLEAASARYEALGFVLKPGRAHANGIRNRHVKFRDGTEIELVSVSEPRDGLAASYRDHLDAAGDGPVYSGFHAPDMEVVAGHLTSVDWPLRRAGGLLTIDDPALAHVFFGPRNASPTDRPEHFMHANGALRLGGVWWADGDEAAGIRLLDDLGAPPRDAPWNGPPAASSSRRAVLPEAEVRLLPAACRVQPGRVVCGVSVLVPELDPVRAALAAGGVDPTDVTALPDGEALVVAPWAACGLWLEFRVAEAAP